MTTTVPNPRAVKKKKKKKKNTEREKEKDRKRTFHVVFLLCRWGWSAKRRAKFGGSLEWSLEVRWHRERNLEIKGKGGGGGTEKVGKYRPRMKICEEKADAHSVQSRADGWSGG